MGDSFGLRRGKSIHTDERCDSNEGERSDGEMIMTNELLGRYFRFFWHKKE